MKRGHLYYFGTTLDSAGHFLFDITGGEFKKADIAIDDLPFDFYEHRDDLNHVFKIPAAYLGGTPQNAVLSAFFLGSPKDKRDGCVSVFFMLPTMPFSLEFFEDLIKLNPLGIEILRGLKNINW